MRYFLDGYNLFFRICDEVLPIDQKKQEWLASFCEFLKLADLDVLIVFDATPTSPSTTTGRDYVGKVEIVYAPRGLDADTFLVELCCGVKFASQVTVVSEDRKLLKRIKDVGSIPMDLKVFFQLLRDKTAISPSEDKDHRFTSQETDRWHKIFEKRLNKDVK